MTTPGQTITSPPVRKSFLPAVPRGRVWASMLVAFAVEALILATIVLWLARHPPPPVVVSSQFAPIRLDLTRPPTPEAASTAPPASDASKTREPAKRTTETAKPAPKQNQAPASTPSPQPAPPQTTPGLSPTPPAASPPQAAPYSLPPSSSNVSLSPPEEPAAAGPPQPALFTGNGQVADNEFLRRANAALHEAARKMNTLRGFRLVGRVLLVVHYRDGKAWDPRIVKSSGLPMLDEAVAEAATQAKWPPPPPGYEGRELLLPIDGSFL